MGGTSMRWVLLLALGLAILGEIFSATDTPGSPTRPKSPLKNIGRAISRKLSRMRSGGSSRSGSGRESDGERSGSDSDAIPASGRNSGSGWPPRYRSPSPTRGGGAGGDYGASSSGGGSSSGGSTITKLPAAYPSNRIPNICLEINNRGAAQIVTNMRMTTFSAIIREMRETANNDECRLNLTSRGYQHGSEKCQAMYGEFKKIEPQYRGECGAAAFAQCLQWPGAGEKKCSFYIKTGYRTASRLDGYYVSLAHCIDGIKHQLFSDDQLAGVGIRPPASPPEPLLPPHYSPDWSNP